jgi:hypothetical protein
MWALVLGVVAAALLFLGSVSAEEPRRWIELDEGVRVWRTEEQIQRLINDKIHFMDVTDHPDLGPVAGLASSTLPATLTPRHPVPRSLPSFLLRLFYFLFITFITFFVNNN